MKRRIVLALALCGIGVVATASSTMAAGSVDTGVVVPSPNTASSESNYLLSVSCASSNSCIAVGYNMVGSSPQTLAMKWDGTSWTITATPNTSTTAYNVMNSVSCVSTTFCVAVGSYQTGIQYQPILLTWNGSMWSTLPPLSETSSMTVGLTGVSCVSTTFCVAVGNYTDQTGDHSIILEWDGTAWSIATGPTYGAGINDLLNSVSCVSTTSCVAVGFQTGSVSTQALTLTRSNGTWSIASTETVTTANQGYLLYGVSCSSASTCMAVGFLGTRGKSDPNGPASDTFVMKWDGTTWSVVASPNGAAGTINVLNSVDCSSSTSCVAVGSYDSSRVRRTLVMTWDGTAWTIIPSPNASTNKSDTLESVTCVSDQDCMAVGYYTPNTESQTLAIRLSKTPSPTTTTTVATTSPTVPTASRVKESSQSLPSTGSTPSTMIAVSMLTLAIGVVLARRPRAEQG